MSLEARERRPTSSMNEQILCEIRDFCRETRTAESTFGRRVVNDGKLVSRLRDGARITTDTLEKVRSFLTVSRPAPAARQDPPEAAGPIGVTSRVAAIGCTASGIPVLRQPAEISPVRLDLQREDGDRQSRVARTRQHPSRPAGHPRV
jgi:hypothetical protein